MKMRKLLISDIPKNRVQDMRHKDKRRWNVNKILFSSLSRKEAGGRFHFPLL